MTTGQNVHPLLDKLGIAAVSPAASWGEWVETRGQEIASINPTTGEVLASVRASGRDDYEAIQKEAMAAMVRDQFVMGNPRFLRSALTSGSRPRRWR